MGPTISDVHCIGRTLLLGLDKILSVLSKCLPMSSWHSDDECKEVINERVEGLVHERPPGQVGHRLQLVVDKKLRQHEQETESVHTVDLKQ